MEYLLHPCTELSRLHMAITTFCEFVTILTFTDKKKRHVTGKQWHGLHHNSVNVLTIYLQWTKCDFCMLTVRWPLRLSWYGETGHERSWQGDLDLLGVGHSRYEFTAKCEFLFLECLPCAQKSTL